MPLMCETCKCSVSGPDYKCDNGCECCNPPAKLREVRFMTGTWYTMTFPADKDYDLEDLYNKYWMGGLPKDVEVHEDEVDHTWEKDSW